MQLRRPPKSIALLNVTPLIDVVFILLVFFMLATNFARYRLIEVETPPETEVVKAADAAIIIGLGPDGVVSFDAEDIPPETLSARIAAIVAIDPGRTFLVRPQAGVSLQDAIGAYDQTRAAGATVVSFSPPPRGES